MTDAGGGQWKLNLRLVGEALGRTNDAERLLTDYDREAAQRGGDPRARIRRTASAQAPRVAVALATPERPALRHARLLRGDDPGRRRRAARPTRSAGPTIDRCSPAAPDAAGHVDGRFTRVDGALWWGPGGALARKAALTDLQRALAG